VIFFFFLFYGFRLFFDGRLNTTKCLHQVLFSFMGKTTAETVTMLREAFNEEALSQARVYEWFSRFKCGDMSLENQPRSGVLQQAETTKTLKKFAMR
jgi:hypothetical protein